MRLSESPRVRCNDDDSGEVVVTVAVVAVFVAVVEDKDGKTEKRVWRDGCTEVEDGADVEMELGTGSIGDKRNSGGDGRREQFNATA